MKLETLIKRRDELEEQLRQIRAQIKLARPNKKPKRTSTEIQSQRAARHKMY